MNVPDVYEFAITPAATYVLAENGPASCACYTDGRKHPPAEELWGTYTGASVGRWEGDNARLRNRRPQGIARQRRDRRSHRPRTEVTRAA